MKRKKKKQWITIGSGVGTDEFSRFGVMDGGPVCDFCMGREFRWRYRCKPFLLPADGPFPEYLDDGNWAACDDCKDDIASGDFDRMDARLFLHQMQDMRPGEALTSRTLAWTHRLRDAFLANLREGPIADG